MQILGHRCSEPPGTPPPSFPSSLYNLGSTQDSKGGSQVLPVTQIIPRCFPRPKSFQMFQEINRNKLVPFGVTNYLFPHSPFCLLFPKAKHPAQVGARGKMSRPNPNPTCFSIGFHQDCSVFPTVPRPQQQLLSGTRGVGTGTPIPLPPENGAHPIEHPRSRERGTGCTP